MHWPRWIERTIVAFVSALLTCSVSAQVSLVKDINPGSAHSGPVGLVELDGKLLFAADDGIHGYEPWISDGTPAGTALLADLRPGIGAGIWNSDHQAPKTTEFATVRLGQRLWFFADRGQGSRVLYATDGTPGGTTPVRTFDAPPASYFGGWQLRGGVARGELIFLAYTVGGLGWSFWRTDSATGGVVLVKGLQGNFDFSSSQAVVAGDKVFFVVHDFLSVVLWVSDGTPGATFPVTYLGSSGRSYPAVAFGDRVAFAKDDMNGNELWSSDGTLAGTGMVADLQPGPASSSPQQLRSFGRHVLFTADDGVSGVEPWISDGRAAGTRLVADLVPGPGSSRPSSFTPQEHRVWFTTRIGGEELWVSDGTAAGTRQVVAFPSTPPVSSPPNIAAVGSRRIVFRGPGPVAAFEPWVSDGTIPGTVPLAQISRGFGALPDPAVLAGGSAYFAATDLFASGREVYRWTPGATSQPIGGGHASAGGPPRMFATDPVLGGTLSFDGEAAPNAPGVVLIGAPAIPVGAFAGADLWVAMPAPVAPFVRADALGRWSLPPIALPNVAGLSGVRLAAQGVFLVSTGFEFTNGALLTLGY